MSRIYTTGNWQPSAGTLQLARDLNQPGRFVSFGDRETIDRVRDRKSSPEFRGRMARILHDVDEFRPAELALVATAQAGATATITPVGIA